MNRTEYVLRLRPEPRVANGPDEFVRLRRLLKRLGRAYGLHCVFVAPANDAARLAVGIPLDSARNENGEAETQGEPADVRIRDGVNGEPAAVKPKSTRRRQDAKKAAPASAAGWDGFGLAQGPENARGKADGVGNE
jgi:hypothetical protein